MTTVCYGSFSAHYKGPTTTPLRKLANDTYRLTAQADGVDWRSLSLGGMVGNCILNLHSLRPYDRIVSESIKNQEDISVSIYLNFPPPSNWQDFQILTARLVEQMCESATVREYGRQGQRQNGVDVYGEMPGELQLGVQCKEIKSGNKLSLHMIKTEADAAQAFKPDLDLFIIATTLAEDTALHKAVTTLNQSKAYPFKISYWSWNHFNDKLNRSSQLMAESYKSYAKSFDISEQLLELEAICDGFSRPAFIDDFHHELSTFDFLETLGDTRLFLQAGLLRDRLTGELLRGTYPLSMLPVGESKKLRKRLLDDVTEIRKLALKDHANGQLNRSKAPEYNALRYALISEINKALVARGIPKIVPNYGA